jgi:hypothetical protein
MQVTLAAADWEAGPPSCPACDAREMQQEFKPFGIGGSVRSKAVAIAEDIVANDYQVADIQAEGRQGGTAKVRYKDQVSQLDQSTWTAARATIEAAVANGRQSRLKYGSGLDVLHSALKSGAQPDLIAESKKRAIRVW